MSVAANQIDPIVPVIDNYNLETLNQLRLIDKKISEISLTTFEDAQHAQWMASSSSYANLYEKMKDHYFEIGDKAVKIYDLTQNKIVKFMPIEPCPCKGTHCDQPTGDVLAFNGTVLRDVIFSRHLHTDFAVVQNRDENKIEILEQETVRPEQTTPFASLFTIHLNDKKTLQFINYNSQGQAWEIPIEYYVSEKSNIV